jgi:succinate-semialdehyde dehydrogenase / glutarate-semialdehyde dehydrogenase
MNDEPFGPVALFSPFSKYEDAINEANRLPFGLAAYAFTSSGATLARVAQDVEVGMLTMNHLGLAVPEAHFGGVKDSGYGSEGGADAIRAYLTPKFITRPSF